MEAASFFISTHHLPALMQSQWLTRADPPGQQFKQDIDQALDEFGRIATDPTLRMGFTKINKRIAPVEFVFIGVVSFPTLCRSSSSPNIGVLIYVLRKAGTTPMDRAQAIYHMRTDIREQFLDIRLNNKVGTELWRLIKHLKHSPTTSILSAPVASVSKKKRRLSEDSDYHPAPIKSLGKNPKTRSRRD
jgi:hypothetical protein